MRPAHTRPRAPPRPPPPALRPPPVRAGRSAGLPPSKARRRQARHKKARQKKLLRLISYPSVSRQCYPSRDMEMPDIFRKVFLLDLIKGMGVTFRYQDPKEIYTEQYPLERPQVAERYRGAPRLNVNPDTDETLCIACDLCALACPENLIGVGTERKEKTRRKELTNFT